MTTFTNAINEAKEWKLQGSVRNGELQISKKSGTVVIKINSLGQVTYQAAGYDNSAKDIASKVVSKQIVEKNETIKVEQVKEKTFNTGFGYYGTNTDAKRGFDGIE